MRRFASLLGAFAILVGACGDPTSAAPAEDEPGPTVVIPRATSLPGSPVPGSSVAPGTDRVPGSSALPATPLDTEPPSDTQPAPETVVPATTAAVAPSTTTTTSAPTTTPAPTSTQSPSPTSTQPPLTTTITEGPPPTTSTTPPATDPPDQFALRLELVAEGFRQPVFVAAPPGDTRLFVVDQPGQIFMIDGPDLHTFLDIRDAVRFRGEQGLLGLAFHPGYAANGLFYVDFIDNGGDTVLSEFSVDPGDRNAARAGSRRDILTVDQPASNHNGGMIAFGPDGLLWLGLGDGGGGRDRYGNGQRTDRRLGSMIRVEVGPGSPLPYGDPDDGPFVDSGGLPEVWSIGLRNPWRWAFDGDDLYIADVGQGSVEEVNLVDAAAGGLNFGWPILEGRNCFESVGCDEGLLAPGMPLHTYSHRNGCSVTGGFVYRGSSLPEIEGHYFFGDFCGGWIDSLVPTRNRTVKESERWFGPGSVAGLTSFGFDGAGELYVLSSEGEVFRIVRA